MFNFFSPACHFLLRLTPASSHFQVVFEPTSPAPTQADWLKLVARSDPTNDDQLKDLLTSEQAVEKRPSAA